jgi:hypothetical protein
MGAESGSFAAQYAPKLSSCAERSLALRVFPNTALSVARLTGASKAGAQLNLYTVWLFGTKGERTGFGFW